MHGQKMAVGAKDGDAEDELLFCSTIHFLAAAAPSASKQNYASSASFVIEHGIDKPQEDGQRRDTRGRRAEVTTAT